MQGNVHGTKCDQRQHSGRDAERGEVECYVGHKALQVREQAEHNNRAHQRPREHREANNPQKSSHDNCEVERVKGREGGEREWASLCGGQAPFYVATRLHRAMLWRDPMQMLAAT